MLVMATMEQEIQRLNGDINSYSKSILFLVTSHCFSALVGLMPYIDWTMVIVTMISCVSMLFESPWPPTGENLVMNNFYLQVINPLKLNLVV